MASALLHAVSAAAIVGLSLLFASTTLFNFLLIASIFYAVTGILYQLLAPRMLFTAEERKNS